MNQLTIPKLLNTDSIGFERFFDHWNQEAVLPRSNYPPHNITDLGENKFSLDLAVAGFSKDQLSIEHLDNKIVIRGNKSGPEGNNGDIKVLHQGISSREFMKTFTLAPDVKPTSVSLENGILSIKLVYDIPEEKKPKQLTIN